MKRWSRHRWISLLLAGPVLAGVAGFFALFAAAIWLEYGFWPGLLTSSLAVPFSVGCLIFLYDIVKGDDI
jgi:hypothetical protein